MSLTTPSSSSTSEITTLPNSTTTMELQTSTTTTTATNPLPSMDPSKPNCCPLSFATKRSTSEPTPNPPITTPSTTTNNTHEHTLQLLDLITKDLDHVKKASEDLDHYGTRVKTQIESVSTTLNSLKESVNCITEAPPEESIETDLLEELRELKKAVMKLKLQIPSKYKPHSGSESDANKNQRANDLSSAQERLLRARKVFDKMPDLCKNKTFENSLEFKDFKALYDGLDIQKKVCLLCFSVFPENQIIKKRFMLYWWIGEGFVSPIPESNREAEDLANEVFNELMLKGFIEPISEKRGLGVSRCKMHPLVRAAVVILADKAKLFDFDPKGNPTGNFSSSLWACLLKAEKLKDSEELEKVHILFNVDETILEFEKPEMFAKMKSINVFCLGRWQTSPKHHIEVEDTKFLEGLKNMRHLRFLSLQGISRIIELPDCISSLVNLTILDLRACHNLEEIPNEIGQLKSLTHLDMSECYLLDNMPKELSSLSELQVLKGFVVGDSKGKNSCTLQHLAKLPKLRKLSIYTGRKDFPNEAELRDLNKFNRLRKLTIAWGGGSQGKSDNNAKPGKKARKSTVAKTTAEHQNPENGGNDIEHDNAGDATESQAPTATTKPNLLEKIPKMRKGRDALDYAPPELPTDLEKLDLNSFPKTYAPDWLKASKLSNIKKLYIRGGTLGDLGQFQLEKHEWEVEILRLKYLNELEMDWTELQELFPNLSYLEKEKCPKLTLFPCDGHGVWMRNPKKWKQL